MSFQHHKVHHHSDKVRVVMHEYKHGTLHSGSRSGPVVHDRRQAIAIALSMKRRQERAHHAH